MTSVAEPAQDAFELPRCPTCGGAPLVAPTRPYRDRLHGAPGRFGLASCAGCGLIATTPRPVPERMGAYYPADYVSFASESGAASGLRRLLRDALRVPYLLRYGSDDATARLRPGRVLDVGCGSGVALAALARRGWEVAGLEPSAEAAATARRRLGGDAVRIAVGRAEDADYPPGSFDLVVMSHVLEHLHDPRAVVEKIGTWLAPGGVLLVRVPDVESLEAKVFGRFWFGLDVPRHLFQFGPASLRRLVEASGLDIVSVRPQFQASSLSGSVSHVLAAAGRRRSPYRHSQRLYLAALPFAAVLLGLGQGGALELIAKRPEGRAA